MTGALPQLNFRPVPIAEATAAINAATLLILMLETPEAVENVEAIAAVPGFDVLLVGTNDLCMEMGIPGQLDHPRIGEAFERIVAACRANGKHAGLGGVYDLPLMERYLAMGFRLVLAGSDLSFMLGAAKARAEAVRAMALGETARCVLLPPASEGCGGLIWRGTPSSPRSRRSAHASLARRSGPFPG